MLAPRVNILLPTFEPNTAHLHEALTSLLEQTEKRWTLFIHDDASLVDVRAMIEEELTDPRITFARSRKRRGIGGNWNATMEQSPGGAPFIQFLFQDDVWHPHYLERALAVLEKNRDVGCVAVQHDYLFEGECPVREQYEKLQTYRRDKMAPGPQDGGAFLAWWMGQGLHPNIIGEPSFVMLRRSVVETVGAFAEDMPQFLDVEYWTRVLGVTSWYNLPGPLGTFRVHDKGASERNRTEGRGLFDRLRCMERVERREPRGRIKHKMRAALEHHLALMIRKYRARTERGGATSTNGRSGVLAFALRHPIITLRAYREASRS